MLSVLVIDWLIDLKVDFLGFPKVSQHPAYVDDAIIHEKPFGIPLIMARKCTLLT